MHLSGVYTVRRRWHKLHQGNGFTVYDYQSQALQGFDYAMSSSRCYADGPLSYLWKRLAVACAVLRYITRPRNQDLGSPLYLLFRALSNDIGGNSTRIHGRGSCELAYIFMYVPAHEVH